MKIVVIGANGQLGSDCCSLLADTNETMGCDIPGIDITNEKNVADYLEQTRPEVIVNCAAYTAVDQCESEAPHAWQVNVDGPKYMARSAARLGARLIHISTDYVFDGHKPPSESYYEQDAPNPLSQYGRTKLAGELAVATHVDNHVILRTAWLYGANGKNFLKTMLRLAMQKRDSPLRVVDDQFGSLTWSHTLAQQIKALLNSNIRGIVHATADGSSSWYGAARYFLDTMGIEYQMDPCTTAEYPTPAHRPANSILANGVLEENGLSMFSDWRRDIDRFVAQHREQLLAEARA